jgi:uncharacterized protein (DUF1684 family)
MAAADPLAVADWRREVFALYAAVRAAASPAGGHALWRSGRDRLLREHRASPVPVTGRATYPGADVATYDPAYRFVVRLEPAPPGTRAVPIGADGATHFDRVGRFTLPGLGSLDVWWLTSYGNGLFVPMHDSTCGRTSYGGGRYLLDTVKGADLGTVGDAVVVDLNFAYQPSCAYDPEWVCPLPAAGNRLAAAVPVGERYAETGLT